MASALGATTSSAKALTVLRNSSCSGSSVKSMGRAPSWGCRLAAGADGAKGHPTQRPRRWPGRSGARGVLEAEQRQVVAVTAVAVPFDRGHQLVQDLVQRAGGHRAVERGAVDELSLAI